VDDSRVGQVVRTLRWRLRWRQIDLSAASGVPQSVVSLIERGHLDHLSLRTIRNVLAALDARTALDVRWRGADLDRVLDENHSQLVGQVASTLRRFGWNVAVEVTYSEYGERGSIDILAFHGATASLLVIEVKTEIASVEEMLRRHDAKVRLGSIIGRKQFGWVATSVSRLLVLPESTSNRARLARHASTIDQVIPLGGVEVRRWLRTPSGSIAGRLLLRPSAGGAGKRKPGGSHRVRRRHLSVSLPPSRPRRGPASHTSAQDARTR